MSIRSRRRGRCWGLIRPTLGGDLAPDLTARGPGRRTGSRYRLSLARKNSFAMLSRRHITHGRIPFAASANPREDRRCHV